jgi:hypothetical protein
MATVGKCPAEDPHLGSQAILPIVAVLMEVGAVTDRFHYTQTQTLPPQRTLTFSQKSVLVIRRACPGSKSFSEATLRPTLRSTPFASLSGRCAMKPRSAGHLERWAS